jgi:ribosome modulation factor
MSGFPFATAAAVFIYDLEPIDPKGKLGAFNLARFRDLVTDRLLESRVPNADTMAMDDGYRWGWAWPDDENPVSIREWVFFAIRAFVKKPPAGLVNALYDQRLAEERDNDSPKQKLSKDVRAEIKDGIKKDLVSRTPPNVEEHPVLIDTLSHRIVLFNPSAREREGFLGRLERVLSPMIGDYKAVPWTLEHYLRITRPQATLPAEVGSLFLTWIGQQALHQRWLACVLGGETVRIQVALEDRMNLATNEGTVSLDGSQIVDQYMTDIEEENSARVTQIRLHVLARHGEKPARRYNVILDSYGNIPRIKLLDAAKLRKKDDNLESATVDRADDYLAAANFVRILMHAFDVDPLTIRLAAQAQTQLWPGAPTGNLTWHEADTVDWAEKPKEEEEAGGEQTGLFDSKEDAEQAREDAAARIAGLNAKADRDALEAAKQRGYEHGTVGVKENPWPADRAEHAAYEDGYATAAVHKKHDKKRAKESKSARDGLCQALLKNGNQCTSKAMRRKRCMRHQHSEIPA